MDYFKSAMRSFLDTTMTQYILASTYCPNGALKAKMHEEMVTSYIAVFYNIDVYKVRMLHEPLYNKMHLATQEITSNLTDIPYITFEGFDERCIPLFHDKFHEICVGVYHEYIN